MSTFDNLPSYDELPLNETLKMRHAWGVFGADDELGTINLLTAERVKEARDQIQSGRVFNLSLPLDLPNPPLFRENYKHHILTTKNGQDDYFDSFYPQNSSQWDALRHVRAREFGFYNGVTGEEAGPEGNKLGIDKYAEHGIVGRGILIDVLGYFQKQGQPYNPCEEFYIKPDLLEQILQAQGSVPEQGDILLLRTGYTQAYLKATPEQRVQFKERRDCAGLSAAEDTARYLWNRHFAAVCADNPAVEVIPGNAKDGFLHRRLIPLLGFALGELFLLDELAEDCARDGRYTCFFSAAPLRVPGGVGSPANAVAIK